VHVVFFNRSFYPDGAATGQLLTDLAEDLVRQHGWKVTVITGVPLQPSKPALPSQGGWFVGREEYRGVAIRRARGSSFDKRRFVGRATNYVSYFLTACWAGLRVERPDVVVALTDPPIIGLAAWMTAKRAHAPLVMAYQDLFPEVTSLLEDFHSDAIDGALQRVNQFLCRHATRIVALGETMKRRLVENKGAPEDRTVIIANWADASAIQPGDKHTEFAEQHGLTDAFVVMHSGNLGLSQGLETILDAAAQLRDLPNLRIVFQGDGVKKADLKRQAAALGLTNVLFLPYAPKERLGETFAAADVFIVSLQRGMAGYIVPSKLYGILASGRPYVAAVEPSCEVAEITRTRDCGLVVEPGSADALAQAIRRLYEDRSLAARLGTNARSAALVFDRTVQVRTYAALLDEVARSQAAGAGQPLRESA
jgi:glycosyltransferase involved in cell wall biosynthesis